ncbi:MAG: DUF222 domain-containing protein [Gammaproteobacteria bacterium]|nr:DUF222 domain-containing protein [Gammaproteobacteria bacterium]MBP7908444.1 DUF222 domain-containing protein [Pseudomonadales bacterium]
MDTNAFSNAAPRLDIDPQTLPIEALEDEITTLSACITVATWRLLMLIAELDRRGKWGSWGLASCAHWLNWKCGIALGAAREKVRVAHALAGLPKVSDALARGELSYSKARAITRVATPESEDYLLMIARHGTAAHVEKLVGTYRRIERLHEAARANRHHAQRALHWRYDDDGSMLITVRLPAEQGALVLKAITAAADFARAERDGVDREPAQAKDVSAETSVPSSNSFDNAESPAAARRADALCHVAEQFLAHEAVSSRQAERFQVVIHVDEQTLADDGSAQCCHIEHGGALAPETARRLACDASVVTMGTLSGDSPLDIGRRSRSIPPATRRALEFRDQGCRFPGCLNHRYVDAHHIRHWADGGHTNMDNLVLLCRHHHTLLHEGGFTLERRDDGKLLFFRPDGRLVPHVPKPPLAVPAIESFVARCGTGVSAETCHSRWQGERMDLDMAVGGLMRLNDAHCGTGQFTVCSS